MKKIKIDQNIFRAYDIRGAEESYVKSQNIKAGSLLAKSAHGAVINAETAYIIGRSVAEKFSPARVAVGHDSRLSSPELSKALIEGLLDSGVDVYDIGLATSDLLYFTVASNKFDMGFMVTGSHTIQHLNGIKICQYTSGSVTPVYCENGLEEIKKIAIKQKFSKAKKRGKYSKICARKDYANYILSLFPEYQNFKPIKLVMDAGNGTAGEVYKEILDNLNIEYEQLNFEPDGNFPAHDPDPVIAENMVELVQKVQLSGAEFGVAWDCDADRVAFITQNGQVLTGSHMGTIILPWVAKRHPDSTVIVTPPMTRAFFHHSEKYKMPVKYAKVGNSHVKKMMDTHKSPFGAEEANHFMFSESFGTENGIIPLIATLELMHEYKKNFAELLVDAMINYHISGDINIEVDSPENVLAKIEKHYAAIAIEIDKLDGLRMEFPDWRFCIRPSSIDPVLRLNIESKSQPKMKYESENILRLATIS